MGITPSALAADSAAARSGHERDISRNRSKSLGIGERERSLKSIFACERRRSWTEEDQRVIKALNRQFTW